MIIRIRKSYQEDILLNWSLRDYDNVVQRVKMNLSPFLDYDLFVITTTRLSLHSQELAVLLVDQLHLFEVGAQPSRDLNPGLFNSVSHGLILDTKSVSTYLKILLRRLLLAAQDEQPAPEGCLHDGPVGIIP